MLRRPLGNTGLRVSPLGFGAVKIGRNRKLRYAHAFELPDDGQVAALLNGALDLGVNLIDTAPAYGTSEQRIGQHLATRRDEFVLTTKAGEDFDNDTGLSCFDFSFDAITRSVERSLERLRTEVLDAVLLHSDGDDLDAMNRGAADALQQLRDQGKARCIGLSGKTVEGAEAALAWADLLMVEFHADDTSHHEVMNKAKDTGVGVIVKKGLAAGRLEPEAAVRFLMREPAVDTAVIGTLSLKHIEANLAAATAEIDRDPSGTESA